MKRSVLLLSAYDASSHRLWRERLVELFPDFQWTQLTLPARNFNWRIRGNSLEWGFKQADILQRDYQLLIATSMVDLASLRGFVPSLSRIPSLVYFHENQFEYPTGSQRHDNIEPQLVPLYAALCADCVIFNSHYNRTTFLEGARNLFQKLPDQFPEEIIQHLEDSVVIPVPLPNWDCSEDLQLSDSNILEVVWNHRWEYDKGPELLLELANFIKLNQLPIRLHIAGEQFRNQPAEFDQLRLVLEEHAAKLAIAPGQFGYIADRTDYFNLLKTCDIVLSTALHDFQGLAVQEACLFGCTPLAPDKLVYPEYLDANFLYPSLDDKTVSAQAIADRLKNWLAHKTKGLNLPKPNLDQYKGESLRPRYAEVFERISK